eukprot:6176130-Pleurochrysis_carterae.AAC.2
MSETNGETDIFVAETIVRARKLLSTCTSALRGLTGNGARTVSSAGAACCASVCCVDGASGLDHCTHTRITGEKQQQFFSIGDTMREMESTCVARRSACVARWSCDVQMIRG